MTALFNSTLTLLFMIFLYSYLNPRPECTANPTITWISNSTASYKSLKFIPNIDLTNQFTLNTKQIFLYMTVKDLINKGKEEMVWSSIIRNNGEYKLFNPLMSNYIFTGNFLNKYEFEIRGNIFPYVGQLFDVSYGKFQY